MPDLLSAGTKPDRVKLERVSALLTQAIAIACQQNQLFSISGWLEKQWLNQCVVKWGSLYQVALQLEQSESTIRRRYAKLNKQDFAHLDLAAVSYTHLTLPTKRIV